MIIMSVDVGDARTGIAVCDKSELLASPVCVIEEYNNERRLEKVSAKAKELSAELHSPKVNFIRNIRLIFKTFIPIVSDTKRRK